MTSKTFTITARQFRDLVTPVLPLASKGRGEPPVLAGVQFRTSGRYLIAATTDRFRAGIARTDQVASPPEGLSAVLGIASIRSILAIFKPSRQADPELSLTFTEGSLIVQALGIDLGEATVSGEITYQLTIGQYPDLASLFAKALTNEPDPAPVNLNPSLLADFRHAQTMGEPMTVRFHGAMKPVIVQVGDNFIGLIQPVRFPAMKADTWTDILADDDKAEAAKKSEAA